MKRINYDSLNTGSTQPLITQKSLKTVNVVLPDENNLFEFEKLSKIYFDNIYVNQKEIINLQNFNYRNIHIGFLVIYKINKK